jgi:deoxyribodipyrimidine photo-lyase
MKSSLNTTVPSIRIRNLTHLAINPSRSFVLYWMTAFRRTQSNFALQRAVEIAQQIQKPLVILEALRCNYRWASHRFHQFVLDGMVDNAKNTQRSNALYVAYVEPESGNGSGLIEHFSSHAAVVVSDDFPCFFHPAMYERFASRLTCSVELVDSNTILPMRAMDRTFSVAHSYRRAMQKEIAQGLPQFPEANPLNNLVVPKLKSLPPSLLQHWPLWVGEDASKKISNLSLDALPIDKEVASTGEKGGPIQGALVVNRFFTSRLSNYSEARNEPEQAGSSWLSPYLHFGHVSPHTLFEELAEACEWSPAKLGKPNGKMTGFWNMNENSEAFLDQLMTWREIGFNMCSREKNYDRFESLPDWAQKTLEQHELDERPHVYSLEEFDQAKTHDLLWNAAQIQLKREGRIHNYLRMLWGKKILHWTASPRQALKIMIELNNKYALDGRDPNSYSGIFWVLGRYDRAWGPERPVFGKIRYMTSESTQSKFHIKQYVKQYS